MKHAEWCIGGDRGPCNCNVGMHVTGIVGTSNTTPTHVGLSAIDPLPKNYIADIMSDDYRLREKINEIAEKVNILIKLKQLELQK